MITVCVSAKRTGSTFLYRCFHSHPDIEAYGEMFELTRKDYKAQKKKFFNRPNKGYNCITFKLMYNQIDGRDLLKNLVDGNMKIIHLIRRNSYEQVLSNYVLKIARKKVENEYIKPKDFLDKLVTYEKGVEFYRRRLSKNSYYIEVFMEDNIGEEIHREKTFMKEDVSERLCDFLDVNYYKMWSDTKKLQRRINKGGYWSYVKNADEIKEMLKEEGKYSE